MQLILLGVLSASFVGAEDPAVEFNRDIRPILANNCFVCHGPDNNLRKANLRLDDPKSVFAERKGPKILVPGDPAKSELFLRITSHEPSKKMPPPKTKKTLTPQQVELIRDWIEQGG